jgi:diguanylate cyclase (GGDEF)-like protein
MDALGDSKTKDPKPRRIKDRGRIFASGAIAVIATIVAVVVVLYPLSATRDDLRKIAVDGVPLQAQLVELRTTVVDWQFFIERHLDDLAPGAVADPAELVKGAELVTRQSRQAAALSRHLRRIGFTNDARALDAAISAFIPTLTKLGPVASGARVDPATLRTIITTERAALEHVWTLTTQIGRHLSENLTTGETTQAKGHLDEVVRFFLGVTILVVLTLAGVTVVAGRRAGRRERERQQVAFRHAYESQVQQALEMTKSEPEVYGIVGEALHQSMPNLNVEMLIADSSRAHFHRALTNNGEFEGCSVGSPLGCPAATVGHALLFPSSRALDACPFLKHRPSGECSAACVPVSIAGRTVGVTHAVGRDGVLPARADLDTLNFTSRRGSERIAMIRAFATSETQAHTDPLTGLLNRRSVENAVRDLRAQGTPYALAYGDLDHFKVLNDTHGHEAGDQALRLFARVLNDSLRPNDIPARYGGEEFVIILPDCNTTTAMGILERVRENLTLALNGGHVPPFTVTFGLASSAYAADFEEIVAIADHALLEGKSAGRNRVELADLPAKTTEEPGAIVLSSWRASS